MTWEWHKPEPRYPETLLLDGSGEAVLAIYESHGGGAMPSEANARLIAAAPELFQHLKTLIHGFDLGVYDCRSRVAFDAVESARKVLRTLED